jgi:type II secretory pathway component PulF
MILYTFFVWFTQQLMRYNFNLSKRLKFYRILVKATDERRQGVRVKQVLEHLMRIEKRANKNSLMFQMYKSWLQMLNQGKEFGMIISKFVPPAEAMIISAAETSGKISDGFALATEVARTQSDFKKAFQSALVGPIVLLVSTVGVISFFCIHIFPAIADSLDKNQLSGLSSFAVGVMDSYVVWFPTLIISVLVVIIITMWALPNYKAGFRSKLETIPPFSLYRIFVGCSFLHAFNSLTKAGVQQVKSLQKMSGFASPYLKYRIEKIMYFMNRGMSFGQALVSIKLNFPDREVVDELSMHAETGNIDAVLDDVVSDLNTDGLELIKLQAAIAKYVCTTITVVVVLWLVLSLFSFVKDMQAVSMH